MTLSKILGELTYLFIDEEERCLKFKKRKTWKIEK